MVKNALAVSSAATLIATGYLSLSLIILNPPRANFRAWFALAAVLAAQSLATIVAINMSRPPAALRMVVMAGAFAFFLIAIWRVRGTLAGTHFEGYNLLLGVMLVIQGALTLMAVRPFRPFPAVLPQSH